MPTATHQIYDMAGGVASLVPGQPSVVTSVAASLHHFCLLDNAGNCYCWGDNAYGEVGLGTIGGNIPQPTKLTVDSLGNPFNNIVQVVPGASASGYETIALKGDGTVWVWGGVGTGNRGNGTMGGPAPKPVQVPFPAGVVIKKVQMDIFAMGLDANGNVWTWGGNTGYEAPYLLSQGTPTPSITTPTMISIPSPVVDIEGGSTANFALCANGDLYGWGYYANYLGLGATASAPLTPTKMNSILGFTQAIKQISINNESNFVLLADSTIWAWGDNACGTIGNGQQLNWATYINSSGVLAPYAWDWGEAELLVPKPIQIAVGLHSFTNLFNGLGDVFYTYAEDVNGNLYSWGRNKGGVLGNGEMNATGDILSIYPNSWDVPWVTKVDPFGSPHLSLTSSPYCVLNPSGAPCNEYAIPAAANPVANAGPNQNITTSTTTLTGSATTASSNTYINYWLWTQVSGPSTALICLPSGPTAQLSNLVTGTYVFQLQVTDNNWRTSTSTVTVVVNSSGTPKTYPKAKTNSKITITLPVNSATLDGSASVDSNGGTLTSYAWQQNSGPNSATIATPTAAKTGISGMVAGTYTFSLTVTDNQGATSTAADTVVVLAAALTPPTVSAGAAQTITLPISTVTLSGTATGTNGATIASTTWTQTGGPSAATIVSVGNLITVVSGLVQGTYTFSLSATDNNGQTASSTVTITVNAAAATPPPTVSGGSAQTITLPTNSVTLSGTATGNGGATISSSQWVQTSGPSAATIGVASSLSTSVSNLVQGTYTFSLTATDNHGQSASSSVTITVNAAVIIAPTVSAGSAQTITLPVNSATLTGTATGNGGATISSSQWTQTAGPSAATIGAAGSLSTSVSGLVQGTYTFTLTATDNNGQSASSSVTITVNAAALPTVTAGSAQTITLPTNSVTLTGTATGNNGATISSTTWSQVSGPGAASIGATGSLSTTVSGLVQGVYVFKLAATDNNGQSASATVTVTVNASAATPPTVAAGSAQSITLPTNSVTLTGTATGNNGATISSTAWTQVSGPASATIGTAGSLSTTVSGLVQGNYVFQLSATDNNGQSASATVTITVNAAPVTPPTVSIAAVSAITLPTSQVTLVGTAAGTNGATIASYHWGEISGPTAATLGTNTATQTSVSNLTVAGTYSFELTVTDNNGQLASAYINVTVNPAPVTITPPTVSIAPVSAITLPTSQVNLVGTAAGTNGATIVSYHWGEISGPTAATLGTNTATQTSVSNLTVAGTYSFELTVTDNNGQLASAYVNVTVSPSPVPVTAPIVSITPVSAIRLPTSQVTLVGTASGTNGATITSYHWGQMGGPAAATFGTGTAAQTTITGLTVAGTYSFELTVTDNNAQIASAYVNVTVLPAPAAPNVNAGADQTITLPTNATTLTGTATGNGGATIVSESWTQTAGPTTASIGSAGSLSTTVSGLVVGKYTFQLTATDNNGIQATSSVNVTVNKGVDIPPIANPGPNQTFTLTGSDTAVNLDGSASYDPDGTIVSYDWYQLSGKGGVTIANSNTATPTIHGLQVGTYVFVLLVTDNSGSTAQAEITITITAATVITPVSTLTANAGKDTIITLPANSVDLNGSASTDVGSTISTYTWSQVSGPTEVTLGSPDAVATQANNLAAGLYVFRLSVKDQLGDTASATVKVTVMSNTRLASSSKDSLTEQFSLYPNPAHTQTTLTMTGNVSGPVDLRIFTLHGHFVEAMQVNVTPGTNTTTINVSNLAAGMYIIRASYGNNTTSQIKLMKQ
ncbi:hypothetical protein GCM10011511_45430 [Puia dinghuensis]|uniref:T9SS C-terminal target domain-containing protein n=2 Tax=Puia dinghuensis TaxID=1792502 RepID=A0A8J2UH25_9BACT|nr:hypothetical protein GCM10011511_45430 [Puia dinghuensis]